MQLIKYYFKSYIIIIIFTYFFNYYEILFLMNIIILNDNKIINIIENINYYSFRVFIEK